MKYQVIEYTIGSNMSSRWPNHYCSIKAAQKAIGVMKKDINNIDVILFMGGIYKFEICKNYSYFPNHRFTSLSIQTGIGGATTSV